MSLLSLIEIILAIAVLVLIGYTVFTLIQLRKTLVSIDTLAVNVNKQIDPLLEDLHSVVKQINNELDQVDDIVLNIRDIGDKVNATTRLAHDLISSPLIKIASISTGTMETIKKLVSR